MKIVSNSAISIDGKINTKNKNSLPLGSPHDRKLMKELRDNFEAVLVGGNSFRHWPYPLLPLKPTKKKIWNIVISRSLDVPLYPRFTESHQIRSLFLTSKRIIPKKFPCQILQSQRPITPTWIVRELAKLGIKKLLIEGGGNLIYQFLKAGLLNEMYVTLCPLVIGDREAPGIVTGSGFLQHTIKRLKLKWLRKWGNEIYLRYLVF